MKKTDFNTMKYINIIILLFGIVFILTCSSDTNNTPVTPTTDPVTAVKITSTGPATKGTNYALAATVSGGKSKTVTWTIKTPVNGVSIGGTNNNMLVTTAAVTATSVTVVATSTDDGATAGQKVTAEQVITIETPAVTQVSITSTGPATKGTNYALTATVTGGTSGTVVWTIKTPVTGATIGGDNNDMLLTTAAVTAPSVTVVATSTDDGATAGQKVTAEQVITIETLAVTQVSITSTGSATKGTNYALTATVTGGISGTVVWTIKTPVNGVSIGGDNNDMLVTTAAVTATSVTVVATSTDDGATAGQKVTAEQEINIITPVSSVSITSTGPAIKGRNYALAATVVGGVSGTVVWTIKTPVNGVSIGGDNNDMLITAEETQVPGTVTVVATSTDDGTTAGEKITAEQEINIIATAAPITGITIDSAGPATIGQDYVLLATITGGAGQGVTWTLEPAANGVSIVDKKLRSDRATVMHGTTVTIKATSVENGDFTDTQMITLNAPAVTAVTVDSTGPVIIGVDYPLTATVTGGLAQSVTWTIVNPDPANGVTIAESNKLRTDAMVVTHGTTVTIKATSKEAGTVAGTTVSSVDVTITLNAPAVTAVTVDTTGPATIGVDYPLTATVTGGLLQTVTWTLKDTASGVSIGGSNDDMLLTTTGVTVNSVIVVATSTENDADGQKVTQEQAITLAIPPVTQVSITTTGPVIIGTDYTLSATVTGGLAQTVIWTIDPAESGVTIEGGNKIRATNAVADGTTVTLKATSTEDGINPGTKVVATQAITINTNIQPVTQVSITSTGPAIIGTDYTLTATVTGGAGGGVTWTIKSEVSGVTIVEENKLRVALNVNHDTTVTVIATSKDDGATTDEKVTAEQVITINAPAPTDITITSAVTATIGTDHTLTATVAPQGAIQTVNWTIEPAVTGVTIEDGNKIRSDTATVRHETTVTVKATSTVATSVSITQEITLNAPAPTGITITSADSATIGTDYEFPPPTVAPPGAIQTVRWSIQGNPAGVSITQDTGILTTTPGTAVVGTVTVVAVFTLSNAIQNTKDINIIAPPPTGVTITSTGPATIGIDYTLSATVAPLGAIQTVNWTIDPAVTGVSIVDGKLRSDASTVTHGTPVTVKATSTEATSVSNTQTITLNAPAVTAVSITSTGPAIIGVDYPLTATVTGGLAQSVTWTIVNPDPANGVTIAESNKLRTDAMVVTHGTTVIIKATSTEDGTAAGTAAGTTVSSNDVTITLNAPAVTAVTVDTTGPAIIGVEYPLTATVTGGLLQTVTWTLKDTASGVSIGGPNDDMLLTTTGVTVNSVIVVATSTENDANGQKVTQEQVITLAIPPVTQVSITTTGPVIIGTDYTLSADVTGGLAQTVIWTIDPAESGVTIEGGNKIRATNAVADGTTVTLKATSTEDGINPGTKVVATQAITINTNIQPVTQVSITSTGPAIIGTDYTLTATVIGGAGGGVRWTIKNEVSGVTIAEENKLRVALNVNHGTTVTVIATSKDDGATTDEKVTVEQVITINAPAPTGITITSAVTATIGTDHTLSATVAPQGAIQTVNWTIEPAVTGVTIEEDNKLKSATTVRHGTTVTVKATSTEATSVSITQEITLNAPAPTGITITSADSATIGTDYEFPPPTVAPPGAIQTVRWSIQGNPPGVSITQDTGVLKTTPGTAVVGTITVVAVSKQSNAIQNTKVINIIAPPPTGVTITTTGPATIGIDYTLTATVAPLGAIQTVNWTIDPAVTGVFIVDGKLRSDASTVTHGTPVTVKATSTEATSVSITQEITLNAPAVTAVTVDTTGPATIGVDYLLTATVTGGLLQTVTWVLKDTASGVSIGGLNNDMLLTTTGVTVNSVTVVATSTENDANGQKVTQEQVITLAIPPVTAVSITSTGPATIGEDYTLTARVEGGLLQTVIWTIDPAETGVTIEEGNILRAAATVAGGTTVTLKATSTEDGTNLGAKVVATQEITINTIVLPVSAVNITTTGPALISVDYLLTAAVTGGAGRGVTWTIEEPAVPGVTIEEGNKLRSDSSTVTHGTTVTVKATSIEASSISNTQTITLNTPAPAEVSITTTGPVSRGAEYTLMARVDPPGALQTVTWTIKTPVTGVSIKNDNVLNVASIATVPTTVTVVATTSADTKVKKEQVINLIYPAPERIGVSNSPSNYKSIGYTWGDPFLVKGYTLIGAYNIKPDGALQKGTASLEPPVNGVSLENIGDTEYRLRSTSDAVGSSITVVITAEHRNTAGDSVSREVEINLQNPGNPTDITLERLLGKDNVVALVGGNPIDLHDVFQISTTPFAANPTVTWSVSDESKATVVATTGVLTAISSGMITITVTSTVAMIDSTPAEFKIESAITNPVTKVKITTEGPFYRGTGGYDLEATVTVKDGSDALGVTWTTDPVISSYHSGNYISVQGRFPSWFGVNEKVTIIATSVGLGANGRQVIAKKEILLFGQ